MTDEELFSLLETDAALAEVRNNAQCCVDAEQLGRYVLDKLQGFQQRAAAERERSSIPLISTPNEIRTAGDPLAVADAPQFFDNLISECLAAADKVGYVYGVTRALPDPWNLYVLRLQEQCWYVGITQRSVEERREEHIQGMPLVGSKRRGSCWTSIHVPLQTPYSRPEGSVVFSKELGVGADSWAKEVENSVTLRLMEIFGWRCVRGGEYCICGERITEDSLMNRPGVLRAGHLRPDWLPATRPPGCFYLCDFPLT